MCRTHNNKVNKSRFYGMWNTGSQSTLTVRTVCLPLAGEIVKLQHLKNVMKEITKLKMKMHFYTTHIPIRIPKALQSS